MFHPKPILYYIVKTFEGYVAQFEPDDGLYVREKIAQIQHDTILYKGQLLDPSLHTIILQEADSLNRGHNFNPTFLEQRLREIY